MFLLSLNLEHYRNVVSAKLDFSSKRIFFVGPNGQGKTNLLEAIGLSSNLRSFRKSGMDGLVMEGAKFSRIFYKFECSSNNNYEILLGFENKGNKTLEVDGEKIKRFASYFGQFPSVCMSSRDFKLVREGPSERRKWLDIVLASASQNYFQVLQSFHRAMKERNSILKNNGSDHELDAFEQILIPNAIELIRLREEAIPELSKLLKKYYSSLTGYQEDASLKLLPNSEIEGDGNNFTERFLSNRLKDRQYGTTSIGPHKDDLKLTIDGKDAKTFASEGQQKGLVLGLRFAEFDFVRQKTGRIPMIIADDVLGELDYERRKKFEDLVPEDAQFFASGTEFPFDKNLNDWQIFDVANGTFSSR